VRELDNHPAATSRIDAALYQFITEMQLGVHISLMRDVMGSSFTPDKVAVTYRPPGCRNLAELFECTVLFEQPTNQILFDAAWLDRAPTLGNRATMLQCSQFATTFSSILGSAAGLLAECVKFSSRISRTAQISRPLLNSCGRPSNLEASAKSAEYIFSRADR